MQSFSSRAGEADYSCRRSTRGLAPQMSLPQERQNPLALSSSVRSSARNAACPISRPTRRLSPSRRDQSQGSSSGTQRRRISVACGRCRKRKIRCSGDAANGTGCENCKTSGTPEICQFLRVNSQVVSSMAPIQFAYATSPLGSAAAMSQLNGEYNTYSTGHSSVATSLTQVALPEPVYYPRGQNTYSYGLMPPRAPAYTPAFPTAIAEEPCESYTTYPPPYVLPSQDHLSGAHSYGHQDVPSRWTPITCPERTSLGYSVEPESPYTTATVSSVGSSGSRNPSVSTDGRPILPASYSPGPALPAPSAGDRILPRLPGITNDGSCDTSSALTASASGQQPSQYKFIPQGWPDGSTHMVPYPQNRRNSSRSGTATAGTDSKSSVAASSKDSPLSYSANLGSPRGGANGDAGIWYSSSSNSASLAATTTHNNTITNSGNCNSNDTNKNNKIHTISSLESLGTPMTPHCSFSSSEASLLPPVSTPAAAILPSQNLASTTNVYSLSTGTTYKRGGGGGNGGIQGDSTGSAEGTLVSGQPYTRLRHTPAQMASSTTAETLRRGSVEPFTQSAHRSSVSSYRA